MTQKDGMLTHILVEFHGVWGSFDVKIKIDKEYTVAASGYLQTE